MTEVKKQVSPGGRHYTIESYRGTTLVRWETKVKYQSELAETLRYFVGTLATNDCKCIKWTDPDKYIKLAGVIKSGGVVYHMQDNLMIMFFEHYAVYAYHYFGDCDPVETVDGIREPTIPV